MPAKFTDQEATERRTEILTAAAEVFARKGYETTTVRDLEQATGLTRGGIFFHFPGKRDLYCSAIRMCTADGGAQPMVAQAALSEETTEEALLAIIRTIRVWHAEHPAAMVLFQQIMARKEMEPDLEQLDQEISETMDGFIEGVLKMLQERGIFNPELDARSATPLLHAVLDHLIADTVEMTPAAADEYVRPIVHVLTQGLAPRPV